MTDGRALLRRHPEPFAPEVIAARQGVGTRRIDGTLLPAAGFGLDGIGIEDLVVRDVDVPATFTEALSVGSFSPHAPLRLPTTIVTDVRLPAVAVERASSSAPIEIPDVRPNDLEQSAGLDLIVLSVRLFVRPVLDLQIAALTINDIEATSSIDHIAIEDISAPLTLTGLRLGGLELRELTINRISM